MATTDQSTLYDELLDLYADAADVEKILSYRLPPDKQDRLEMLLRKNRDDQLNPAERSELAEFENLEHFGRMLKARVRQRCTQ